MKRKPLFIHSLSVFFILLVTSFVGTLFQYWDFPETNIVIVYLLSVLIISRVTPGYTYGISASIIATLLFNYLFTSPYYTLAVDNSSYILTFITMTATAVITSTLTSSIQQNTLNAQAKEQETQTLYTLTSRLTNTIELVEATQILEQSIGEAIGIKVACAYYDEDQNPTGFIKELQITDSKVLQAIKHKPNNVYHIDNGYAYWRIKGREGELGIVRIAVISMQSLSELQEKMISSIIENTALAMDRILLAYQKEKSNRETKIERQRSHLLRGISHDLRTPLSGIRATSEMLLDATPIEDPRRLMIETIQEDIIWLHSLVENVLSLTRMQNGRLSLSIEQQALEEIIEEATRMIRKRFPETKIKVKIPEQMIFVSVDVKLILQVFINLLENAIKHASEQIVIKVYIKDDLEDFVCVSIADNGNGIPEEELKKIFEPFHTVDNRHIDSKNRVGSGLTICETAIIVHGGTIRAQNRIGHSGAEFIFTLPLKELEDEVSERKNINC